jgi:hypothetical protein
MQGLRPRTPVKAESRKTHYSPLAKPPVMPRSRLTRIMSDAMAQPMTQIVINPTGKDSVRMAQRVSLRPVVTVAAGLSLISAIQVVAFSFAGIASLGLLISLYGGFIGLMTLVAWLVSRQKLSVGAGRVLVGRSHPLAAPPGRWRVWDAVHEVERPYERVTDIRIERTRDPGRPHHRIFTHINCLVAVCENGEEEPTEIIVALQPWGSGLKAKLEELRRHLEPSVVGARYTEGTRE